MNRPGRWVGRKYTKANMQTDRQTDGKHTSASFTKIGQYSTGPMDIESPSVPARSTDMCPHFCYCHDDLRNWQVSSAWPWASFLPVKLSHFLTQNGCLSFLYRLRRVASCVEIYKWPLIPKWKENADVRLCMSHHYFSSPSRTFCGGRACREWLVPLADEETQITYHESSCPTLSAYLSLSKAQWIVWNTVCSPGFQILPLLNFCESSWWGWGTDENNQYLSSFQQLANDFSKERTRYLEDKVSAAENDAPNRL